MLKIFNTRLITNLSGLRKKKGEIGCPAPLLNPKGQTTILHCIHICGVLFSEWKSITTFYEDGRKHTAGANNCPCIKHGQSSTKDTFWEYIDKLLMASKADLPIYRYKGV